MSSIIVLNRAILYAASVDLGNHLVLHACMYNLRSIYRNKYLTIICLTIIILLKVFPGTKFCKISK
jgi:hypothetical protein